MGLRTIDGGWKQRERSTGTVPSVVGDSVVAITFLAVKSGQAQGSLCGVTALIETIPAGAVVELWLPKVADNTKTADTFDNTDYFYAGLVVTPVFVAYTATGETATFGSGSWTLCGYPGAQLRVKNKTGSGGAYAISGSAY